MAKLSKCLKFFIRKKMQEDNLWKRCATVIFSGHEVPGEGEHKIMEFIRRKKAAPGWNPNTTHCLYGLGDACAQQLLALVVAVVAVVTIEGDDR